MDDGERTWPLIGFTVLGPASVGCLLGQLLLAERLDADGYGLAVVSTALVLAVGGLVASLSHLEKPALAYRALRRFPQSPLSREIVAYSLYLALVFLLWFVELAGSAPRGLTALVVAGGLLSVVATAQVYLLPARPQWSHWSTVASFASTTFTLGLSTSLALALAWERQALRSEPRVAQMLVLTGLAVSAASVTGRAVSLILRRRTMVRDWRPAPDFRGLWWARLLGGIGLPAVLVTASLYEPGWLAAAWLCLLLGEVTERWLFFSNPAPFALLHEIPGARQ